MMIDNDTAQTEFESEQYEAWALEHQVELEAQMHAAWVETLCEGHESTDGPIGNVVFCDGTCVPLSERDYDAWVADTEADDPRDV